jgi:hypothetical protein
VTSSPQALAQMYATLLGGLPPGGMPGAPNAIPGGIPARDPNASQNLSPNVLANLQSKGVPSAAGAALRDQPPKGMTITPPTSGNPNPMPTGGMPPGPPPVGPAPSQNPASQEQALLGQWQAQPPPFTPPAIPQPSKGQLLGEALAALFIKGAAPFVGAQIVYDDERRQKDYENKYKSTLDQWTTRQQAVQAENQGLVQRADILRNLPAPVAGLIGKPPTLNPKDTEWQQHTKMADWELNAARTLMNAGYSQESQQYASMANDDRMAANEARLTEGGTVQPHPVGWKRPDGTLVQPGDPEDTANQTKQAVLAFDKERTTYEHQVIMGTDPRTQLAAQRLAQSASFHTDELQERWQINAADRTTRETVAILGLEATNGRYVAGETERAGIDAYNKQMQLYQDQFKTGYSGPAVGEPAAPGAPPLDININVNAAANQAKGMTSAVDAGVGKPDAGTGNTGDTGVVKPAPVNAFAGVVTQYVNIARQEVSSGSSVQDVVANVASSPVYIKMTPPEQAQVMRAVILALRTKAKK